MIDLREHRIRRNGLVHDITDAGSLTDNPGVETGCGVVMQASFEALTDDPTSCLTCISDNVNYERLLNAIRALHHGAPVLDPTSSADETYQRLFGGFKL